MKSSISKQTSTPAVTSLEGYLPGLAQPEGEIEAPGHPPAPGPFSGWWVRRSAKQITDAAGQPVGFRHQLMHGREVVKSGVGADYARTFREQASFLNGRSQRAQ
jgi:hypothetical protein